MRHFQTSLLPATPIATLPSLRPLQLATSALERGDWTLAQRQIDEVAQHLAARAVWLEEDLRQRYESLAQRFAEHARNLGERIVETDGRCGAKLPQVGLSCSQTPKPTGGQPVSSATLDGGEVSPAVRVGAGDSLSSMACPERLRQLLTQRFVLPLCHPEQAARYRQQVGGGLLLFGPPGTGKTHLVRAMARELSLPVFNVSPAEVLSKWLGDSEKRLAQVFAQARSASAALVFIDEIDVLAPRRDAAGSEAGGPLQRLLAQLLAELDGFEQRPGQVFFVGATNRPWALDEALLRPGRFDTLAWVGTPDSATRSGLLRRVLSEVPLQSGLAWDEAADALVGRSVAQTLACARHAAQMAFVRALNTGDQQPVSLTDLLHAAAATASAEGEADWGEFRAFAARHAVADQMDACEAGSAAQDPVAEIPVASGEEVSFEPLRFVQARDLHLELETLPFISYAMQHAGLAPVRQISLTNQCREESQNLLVEVALVPLELGEAWSITLPALAAGDVWRSGPLSLPLSLERLRKVVEKEQAHLRITVRDRDEVLLARTESLPVLAFNEWVYLPKFLELTSAFVQPNSAALNPVVQAAAQRLAAATGSSAFSGYQYGGTARVLQMLSAVHDTLAQDLALDYINPPPSFEQSGQKVRLVADTLAQKRGTCLDLALLQAALWEHIGLEPLVVLVPGHAFLGCWMSEGAAGRQAVTELRTGNGGRAARAMQDALNSGQLKLFNSVEVAHRRDLAAAQCQGMAILREILSQGLAVQFIDIAASRVSVTPLP